MRPMGRKKGSCSIRRTPQNRAAPLKTRSCGYLSMWRPRKLAEMGVVPAIGTRKLPPWLHAKLGWSATRA